MIRLLFIAIPETFYLPIEQYLLKKGYEVHFCSTSEEASVQIQSGSFDSYIIEPFSNAALGASVIKQLKEWKLLDRVILVLPGINKNEEDSANKIIGKNYIAISDSFATAEQKIVQVISSQRKDLDFPVFLHKPAVQYIKSELEKAKRGRTSLSFIYYRFKDSTITAQDISKILQKINTSVNYRLRISDDAFPFQKGLIILLFGTQSQDRHIISSAIQKRLRRTLKTINIELTQYFELIEATYPDDGNTINDMMAILENEETTTVWKDNTSPSPIIADIFNDPIHHQDLFRLKRKINEIEATNASQYLDTALLAPTWYGALLQLCHEDTTTPRMIEDFILNETDLGDRILQFAIGLIENFPQRYPIENNILPQSIKEAYLVMGIDEFKNIVCLCTLENSLLSNAHNELSVLKEITYSQMAMSLELSKKLDYQNKSELFLAVFCQAVGYFLIKQKNSDIFFKIYEKQSFSKESLGQSFYSELGFSPSELNWLFLKFWGIEEPFIESAYCARYENTPQLNPQLTAIVHISIVLSNLISGLGNESNIKISKIALDEIQLRNRNFKPESLNYLSDNYEGWLQNYQFLYHK